MDKLQDVLESIVVPGNLLISELNSYRTIPMRRRGFMKAVGGYCVVIPLKRAEESKPSKCIRLWHSDGAENKRLHAFSQRLSSILRNEPDSSFFCRQDYYEQALRLSDGSVIPATVMDWMSHSMDLWLSSDDKPTSYEYTYLARQMRELSAYMKENGISHGDLSPANILVGPDLKIKLIDFDSLDWPSKGLRCCMPSIAGAYNFNRRERREQSRASNDDYLAQQLIHLMLLVYSKKPSLNNSGAGDDALLFDESDIASPAAFRASHSYKVLADMADPEIHHYLSELEYALKVPYKDIKPLCDIIFSGKPSQRRVLHPALYCGKCGYRFESEEELYCPICGKKRERVSFD